MSQAYNICLLGFAPDSEERLKKIIHAHQAQAHFVSANHQALYAVVINAIFLSSPQIKKYMAQTQAKILCASNQAEALQTAQQQGFLSLDLRQLQSPQTQSWLHALLGETSASASTVHESPSASNYDDLDNIAHLLTCLEQTSTEEIFYLEYEQHRTWIQLNEGMVYINYPRESIPGIEQWQWKRVKNITTSDTLRPLKLDLWLFETIWQSHVDSDVARERRINEHDYYRLTRWPQPLGKFRRTEALRLAACAQTHPVNLNILREKTSYSDETIKRFLLAALKAKQLSVIAGQPPSIQKNNASPSAKTEEKRSLLRRLRDKLKM